MEGKAPDDAVVLFDGTDLGHWRHRDGTPARWTLEDGAMTVVRRSGDIVSDATYEDAMIHLEFAVPDMPEATGQHKGNSGVFVQGRYEIQVLDSYGWSVPGLGDCGAIYNQFAPLSNACLRPLEWQSYDIIFRAARTDAAGAVEANARITLIHNGVVVHNNVEVRGVTGGAMDAEVGRPGPLRLQDHGNSVRYRNIWFVRLPREGSDQYAPR